MIETKKPIIAIIGPTASGKTTLGIDIAKRYRGEIICADSRTIYRGMNIGTAKPSIEERQGIRHHLLDIVEPNEGYSAQQFKVAAERVVEEIVVRGNTPIIVGGTGLYTYALLYDYQFPAGGRSTERLELESKPLPELVAILLEKDPVLAAEIDLQNRRRVIRGIETAGLPRQKAMQLNSNILLLGLRPDISVLDTNIRQRTQRMLQIGLAQEVQELITKYSDNIEALRSPGYAEIVDFLANVRELAETEELITLHTRQLVKRQLTWFKRNSEICWVKTDQAACELVDRFMLDQ